MCSLPVLEFGQPPSACCSSTALWPLEQLEFPGFERPFPPPAPPVPPVSAPSSGHKAKKARYAAAFAGQRRANARLSGSEARASLEGVMCRTVSIDVRFADGTDPPEACAAEGRAALRDDILGFVRVDNFLDEALLPEQATDFPTATPDRTFKAYEMLKSATHETVATRTQFRSAFNALFEYRLAAANAVLDHLDSECISTQGCNARISAALQQLARKRAPKASRSDGADKAAYLPLFSPLSDLELSRLAALRAVPIAAMPLLTADEIEEFFEFFSRS
eukprot:m.250258 g.250258  ORF g.250258 m.250258 type:complete len:278 (-) comp16617_c0_seq1:252-1085(-)